MDLILIPETDDTNIRFYIIMIILATWIVNRLDTFNLGYFQSWILSILDKSLSSLYISDNTLGSLYSTHDFFRIPLKCEFLGNINQIEFIYLVYYGYTAIPLF